MTSAKAFDVMTPEEQELTQTWIATTSVDVADRAAELQVRVQSSPDEDKLAWISQLTRIEGLRSLMDSVEEALEADTLVIVPPSAALVADTVAKSAALQAAITKARVAQAIVKFVDDLAGVVHRAMA